MTIGITGAAGTLGRLVLEALGDRDDVVAITRDPSKLDGVRAEVRRGDFDDPGSLRDAFAGIDRLLLISTDAVGTRVAGHRNAIEAAVAAGVRHIAYTSVPDPSDDNPNFVAPDHRETEAILRASGADWTFLRNSIYIEMLVPTAQGALASGTLVTNYGSGGISYVARADCAAAAAAVLTGDGHAGKSYDITGSEVLGADAQAALFGKLGGKDVSVTQVDDAAWAAAMVEHAGMAEADAQGYATIGAAARLGYHGTISDRVRQLTGREPQGAEEVLAPLLG